RPAALSSPPTELVAICNRCLTASPEQRFPTALELQSALEDYAQASGGVFSRRELGAFLARSFESQRARRRAVIEEKVKALSDGTVISDSLKRVRTVLSDERTRTSRPTAGPNVSAPPAARRSSGELTVGETFVSEAPLPVTMTGRSSSSNLAASEGNARN